MPIELAGVRLERIHKIKTREQADFVSHRIPGLEGNVVQNMGRDSVRLQIEGIFYGDSALADLEALRAVYKKKAPVDFLAEIIGQAYFGQVILERFEVSQVAQEPEQFSYTLTVTEYVEPPEPEGLAGLADVAASILAEAQSFMDMAELPGILSLPNFTDPTQPLAGLLDGMKSSVSQLGEAASYLSELFGDD